MTRISVCAAISALAVLALSSKPTSAGALNIHTNTPTVNIRTPATKVGGSTSLTSLSVRVIKQPSLIGSTTGETAAANGSGAALSGASNEVIVNFEHGDPNQPYVLGRVYNHISPAPRTKSNLHR